MKVHTLTHTHARTHIHPMYALLYLYIMYEYVRSPAYRKIWLKFVMMAPLSVACFQFISFHSIHPPIFLQFTFTTQFPFSLISSCVCVLCVCAFITIKLCFFCENIFSLRLEWDRHSYAAGEQKKKVRARE